MGTITPAVQLQHVDGKSEALRPQPGVPTLIFYESRNSKKQNQELKHKLKRLVDTVGGDYHGRVQLLPIANLEGLNFWPVRNFAENAIRSESQRIGAEIYCDWNGELRQKLQLKPNLSSIILLDGSGKVIFAAEGALAPSEQERLLQLLEDEIS
jgi:predicted transcriptional regulator